MPSWVARPQSPVTSARRANHEHEVHFRTGAVSHRIRFECLVVVDSAVWRKVLPILDFNVQYSLGMYPPQPCIRLTLSQPQNLLQQNSRNSTANLSPRLWWIMERDEVVELEIARNAKFWF